MVRTGTDSHDGPRVLCVSCRGADPIVSRSLRFELEDVISSFDPTDIICPARARHSSHYVARAAARLDSLPWKGRAIRAPRYRMLLASVQSLDDLYLLAPWSGRRAEAEISVCLMDEVYAHQIPRCTGAIALLKRFDMVFVGCHGSVDALAESTGRQCRYLPPSTDTLRYCPYPDAPERVIDFYSMGRRPPATHQALLRMADRGRWFYHFDSVGNGPVSDHREHRRRLADLIKRTRYFLVNVAQCTVPTLTRGQQEFGYRYFEGAAGGSVLIGHAPDNPVFADLFGWTDSVIPLDYDSDQIAQVIAELDAAPERVERIRRLNVVHSLRRHDHVHRWAEILSAVGLAPTAAMEDRRRTLSDLADSIERTIPGYTASTPHRPEETGAAAVSVPGAATQIGTAAVR